MSEIVNFWDPKLKPNKDLLGGKGASLVRMTQLGMPVPPGFILTTQAWRQFDEQGNLPRQLIESLKQHLAGLEEKCGAKFASRGNNPLLVSVRSGSRYSMPGMMDTISNVGITNDLLPGLTRKFGGEIYALDTYKRFIKTYSSSVYGIHVGEFDKLPESAGPEEIKEFIYSQTGNTIPNDPLDQLIESVQSVLRSWYNLSAVSYRQLNGIPDQIGTAVTIQTMVYGNIPSSGTGVLFTRDTTTGENKIIGDYLEKAQGEDIVRGGISRKTQSIDDFRDSNPKMADKLFGYAKKLELIQKDVQDIEFTIENGKLWLLQSRSAKRTPLANIRIANEFLHERIILEREALRRIRPSDIEHLQLATFDKSDEEDALLTALFSVGTTASPGVAVGYLARTPEDVARLKSQDKESILICDHIDPNDIATLLNVSGVVTTKGSASSHMALIMRSAGIPGIVGASSINLSSAQNGISCNDKKIYVGDSLSINANKGLVYSRRILVRPESQIPADIKKIIDRRISLFTKSSWSAGIYEEEGSPNVSSLVKKVQKLRTASKDWKSEKARVIEVFDMFFDNETMIKNKLVRPDDKKALRRALVAVIKSGYYNAPRTCHSPVKLAGAPWADGPNSSEKIDAFLENPNYPGKYGGYLKWKEDLTLDAIIVGSEPKDKLNTNFSKEHFVCTLSCVNGMTSQLTINIHFGTAQLRSLEQVDASDLATIRINLDPEREFSIGDRTYQLGRSFLNDDHIAALAKAMSRPDYVGHDKTLLRTKRHLLRQLNTGNMGVDPNELEAESLKNLIFDMMTKNMLSTDIFYWVVDKSKLSLLEQISHVITKKWWRKPIYLPHIMSALDEVSGLSVVEAQGRIKNNKLKWFKIYGAKGSEERDKINNWKNG